jgi:hypothetical protein
VLAGRLGDELFEPGAEARDGVVGPDRQLVAAAERQRPEQESKPEARVRVRIGLAALGEHRRARGDE